MLILSADEAHIIVTLDGDSRSRFKIKLLDIEDDEVPSPELNYPVKLDLNSSVLKDMINKVETFNTSSESSSKITFEVDNDYFISYSDNELVDVDIKHLHGENVTENAKSVFNILKIKDIMRAEKLATDVKLYLGHDMPLTVEFDLVDGELSFLLAPRVAEE